MILLQTFIFQDALLNLEDIAGVLGLDWQALHLSRIQVTSESADETEVDLGVSCILLKISFKDLAPLQDKGKDYFDCC